MKKDSEFKMGRDIWKLYIKNVTIRRIKFVSGKKRNLWVDSDAHLQHFGIIQTHPIASCFFTKKKKYFSEKNKKGKKINFFQYIAFKKIFTFFNQFRIAQLLHQCKYSEWHPNWRMVKKIYFIT